MTTPVLDPRATKDRRCVACGTAITRYSTTGYCGPCSSRYIPRNRRKPTEAQQQRKKAVNVYLNTQKRATPLAEGECRHHYLLPTPAPELHGVYTGVCKFCGVIKEHKPHDLEDEAKKKATR